MLFCCPLVKANICCSFCELLRTSWEELQHTLLADPLVPSKHCTKQPWINRKNRRLGLLPHYSLLSVIHQVPLHIPVSGTRSLFLRMAVLPCHDAAVAQLVTSCSTQTFSCVWTLVVLRFSHVRHWATWWKPADCVFKILDGERLWCCMVPLLLPLSQGLGPLTNLGSSHTGTCEDNRSELRV